MNGMASGALQKLDSETRSKIRSTQILTSLPQIVSELVQNSLDAGAKNVEIGIDMDEWACWVRDDGTGISKSGLELVAQGCEHGRYATSKAYNPSSFDHITTFGFRGEALASAADLSCLEIASRTCRSKESWSLIVKGGKTLYNGPSTRWRRERAGTTVAVRDAFYNLPIRRLSHPNSSRTIELIRRGVEAFALVFPNVSFTLEDSGRDRKGGLAKSRVMSVPKTNTTLKAFQHMYGRTLVEHVEEIYEERDSLKMEGFLSLVGSLSKAYQFLFVNKHILDVCDLHRIIDQKFGASSFAKNALDESGETALPRTSMRRSPRKNERKAAYVLNITIPPRQLDNCLEPAKTAVHFQDQGLIVSFLADIIERFLLRHGFKKEKSDHHVDSYPVAKKRKVEIGIEERSHPIGRTADSSTFPKRIEERDIYIQSPDLDAEDETTTWIDPSSGRVYIVDQRTGNSYLKDQQMHDCASVRRTMDVPWQKRSRYLYSDNQGNDEMPNWIKEALQGNKAFAPTERGICDIPKIGPFDDDNVGGNQSRSRRKQYVETLPAPNMTFGGIISTPQSAFTRECIAEAHVIEQVDRKFIACLVDLPTLSYTKPAERSANDRETPTTRILVLVDQHAADERVRVEHYLKTLCLGFLDRDGVGIERRTLNPPVSVLLSSSEYVKLHGSDRAKRAFRSWGFDVCENEGKTDTEHGYAALYFNTVPEVVADKLLLGQDLSEFVKGFLARLESGGLDDSFAIRDVYLTEIGTAPPAVDPEFAWLKALRFCPRELVELINSKACRGAIMFNDELTTEQCKRLMRQLSKTAFPFQCAHGRPSIVPLTTVQAEANVEMTRPVDWGALNASDCISDCAVP